MKPAESSKEHLDFESSPGHKVPIFQFDMLQICDCLEERGIAALATDVFRRTSILAGRTHDARPAAFRREEVFDGDLVLPAVAEVAEVSEPRTRASMKGLRCIRRSSCRGSSVGQSGSGVPVVLACDHVRVQAVRRR